MTEEYKVGYRKPPREHQFKPGQSGNKRGRPKGAGGFKDDVKAALGVKVTITEDGKKKRITIIAAALKRLIHNAVVKGDPRAIEKLFMLAQQMEAGAPASVDEIQPEDQALLDAFLQRQSQGDGA